MSVIMTLRAKADPARLEAHLKENQDTLQSILGHAKENDLIAHRFYGGDGEIMIVDEWPAPENFQRFWDQASGEIGPLMEGGGVASEPEVTFWNKLDTGDEVGWDA